MSQEQTRIRRRSGNPNPRTDHLVPYHFKAGQSGNPGGRPKGVSFVAELRKALVEVPDGENGDRRTRIRRIIDAAIERAEQGDLGYFKELVDRIDGKCLAAELAETDTATLTANQVVLAISRVKAEMARLPAEEP